MTINVVLAADDTDASVEAARAARRLFGDDASYTVVSVAQTSELIWAGAAIPYGTAYPMVFPDEDVLPDSDELRHEAAETAHQVAVTAELPAAASLGEVGDPADVVMSVATQIGADVIVVGSHERNWFVRMFSDSVAKDVLRDAPVPVLVVR